MPRYWLFKSEATCFSYEDLENAPDSTTGWDGVRNYQARNFLRDDVKYGDGVIYYHSNAEPPGIAGIAVVVEEAHPDPTQFDPKEDHFDPKSDPKAPTWVQVSIRAIAPAKPEVSLPELRKNTKLVGLELLRKGSRLSVHPVSEAHWRELIRLAGFSQDPHAQWLAKNGQSTSPSRKPKSPKAAAEPRAAATKSATKTAAIVAKAAPKKTAPKPAPVAKKSPAKQSAGK